MGYELNVPLKYGTLEVEFDDVEDLERQLGALDILRIEKAVAAALRGKPIVPRRKTAKKRARGKKAARNPSTA